MALPATKIRKHFLGGSKVSVFLNEVRTAGRLVVVQLRGGENVALAEQEVFVVADGDFFAAVRAEDDRVAFFDAQGDFRSVASHVTIANSDDRAALRLVASRIGEHDAAGCCFFCGRSLQDNSIAQRNQIRLSHSILQSQQIVCFVGAPQAQPVLPGRILARRGMEQEIVWQPLIRPR